MSVTTPLDRYPSTLRGATAATPTTSVSAGGRGRSGPGRLRGDAELGHELCPAGRVVIAEEREGPVEGLRALRGGEPEACVAEDRDEPLELAHLDRSDRLRANGRDATFGLHAHHHGAQLGDRVALVGRVDQDVARFHGDETHFSEGVNEVIVGVVQMRTARHIIHLHRQRRGRKAPAGVVQRGQAALVAHEVRTLLPTDLCREGIPGGIDVVFRVVSTVHGARRAHPEFRPQGDRDLASRHTRLDLLLDIDVRHPQRRTRHRIGILVVPVLLVLLLTVVSVGVRRPNEGVLQLPLLGEERNEVDAGHQEQERHGLTDRVRDTVVLLPLADVHEVTSLQPRGVGHPPPCIAVDPIAVDDDELQLVTARDEAHGARHLAVHAHEADLGRVLHPLHHEDDEGGDRDGGSEDSHHHVTGLEITRVEHLLQQLPEPVILLRVRRRRQPPTQQGAGERGDDHAHHERHGPEVPAGPTEVQPHGDTPRQRDERHPVLVGPDVADEGERDVVDQEQAERVRADLPVVLRVVLHLGEVGRHRERSGGTGDQHQPGGGFQTAAGEEHETFQHGRNGHDDGHHQTPQ